MNKNDILKEINSIRDHHRDLEKSIDLLYKIQLKRGPLIEVMTIIKHERPCLYGYIKNRLNSKRGFSLLFDLSVNYELAKQRLSV